MSANDFYKRRALRPPSEGGDLGCRGIVGILIVAIFVLGICGAFLVENVGHAVYNGPNPAEAATMTSSVPFQHATVTAMEVGCEKAVASMNEALATQAVNQYMNTHGDWSNAYLIQVTSITRDTEVHNGCGVDVCVEYGLRASSDTCYNDFLLYYLFSDSLLTWTMDGTPGTDPNCP